MKLLVLTSRFPYPLEKGDKLRIYHQLRELSAQHEVLLFCLSEQPVKPAHRAVLEALCQEVRVYQLGKPGLLWQLLRSLLSRLPVQATFFYRPRWHRALKSWVAAEQPDHAYVQLLRMAEYARDLPLPTTLDYMDCFSIGMERRSASSPPWLAWFFRLEARKLRRYERRLACLFTHHTIISAQDRAQLDLPADCEVHIIPNGIDTHFFQPQTAAPADHELVFIGNLGYAPNVEAARVLGREIMPLLPTTYRLLLAGARPTAAVRQLAHSPRVTVFGWVEDIRDAYSRGRIFVAPLFTGSGQQNKILEAMAMGIPCITTPLVNNAIGAREGEEVLLASNPAEFARQIERLQADEALYVRLQTQARRLVETQFSWQEATQRLSQLMAPA
jgi:polysaccharide biosynthesis protein PslH